jgi:hypothetical protein
MMTTFPASGFAALEEAVGEGEAAVDDAPMLWLAEALAEPGAVEPAVVAA